MGTLLALEAMGSTFSSGSELVCRKNLNLYKTAGLAGLVTQAAAGRHLVILDRSDHSEVSQAVQVRLCEDNYPGWISTQDLAFVEPAAAAYRPESLDRAAIEARLPAVIEFVERAIAQPNTYLWGGTVGPNFDCSGLMQTAFAAAGVRLPRDSYQQEAFTQPIDWQELHPGDLVFFGTPERTTHVALYLGNGDYVHSSGQEHGRNGIGIDSLTDLAHPVSQHYHQQLRRPGRVMVSYCPVR
jgi:cell wall-associated NlpC family hydrolase